MKEIFNSAYMKNLRQEFRNGKKPSGCSTCWVDESNGYTSKRLIYTSGTQFIDHHGLTPDWDNDPEYPKEYQMIISNACNLKCRSCSPSHSTLWQAEFKDRTGSTQYVMPHGQAGDKSGKLWSNRKDWYATLKRLEIVGGEPFFIKQWHEVFEELIATGRSKDILIDMSSNCTLCYPDLVSHMCDNFQFIGIGLSIDGTGLAYNYLRHPGNWNDVYANLQTYRDLSKKHRNLNPQITCTIGWLNAINLVGLHRLVANEFPACNIWNNLIHQPERMAIWAAPLRLKERIVAHWDSYQWADKYKAEINSIKVFMFSREISDEQFKANLQEFISTDAYRGEDILTSFPEYADILQDYISG
jgi:MoaA/NifB/PqqE/SkfB family radical SAM enzyme